MFKKVISTALALTMILGLTACGSTVGSGTPETTTTAEAAKAATDETLEKTVEAAENAGYKIGIIKTKERDRFALYCGVSSFLPSHTVQRSIRADIP